MSLLDINGNVIVSNSDFPNNPNVENIEIGAGKNYFGKRYFPFCYLTEKQKIDLPHFETVENYEAQQVHYIDCFIDFYSIKTDRGFKKVIFCNPYMFGLKSENSTRNFLNKIGEILERGGEAFILGHNSNSWSKYRNAKRWLERLSNSGELTHEFKLSPLTNISEHHEYRVNMVFRRMITPDPIPVNECYHFEKIA